MARLFKEAGCDLIDVSSGQTTRDAKPVYGRMYQTPFADRIRNEVGIRTMAVGAITEADQVNSIIAAGRADLCAIARPHLADPAWTLHEAAQLAAVAPRSTGRASTCSGRDQMYREIAKQKQVAALASRCASSCQGRRNLSTMDKEARLAGTAPANTPRPCACGCAC